jgi:hypothetical protein
MNPRVWFAPVFALLAVVTAGGRPQSSVQPATGAEPAPPPATQSTTLDDQTDLAVTVYNSDIALVRDSRRLRLERGTSDLHFMDIAATVNPATVHFRSLSEPARVHVLEQNYEYDLLEPEKLLRKYVGRDVTIVRTRQEGGRTIEEDVQAHLLSYNNGPVWRIGGQIVTGLFSTQYKFPELPENLYSRPTLIWTLDNQGGVNHRVEASYLAGGMGWNADYVLTVARDDRAGDLDGWVTLRNGSGTSFKNASLQLVAGNLNRVRHAMLDAVSESKAMSRAAAPPPMMQEAFSDYHLYSLDRRTTINNNETKQVSMLGATGFPVAKRYVVNGQAMYYRNAQHPGSSIKDDVEVFYQLKNEESAGLGMPLPAGIVRVYQADSKGALQFVGEDRIAHTPNDEVVHLKIGSAFDVVCERKQTDFQKISNNVYEMEFEVTLRNHKTTAVTVEVNEPIGGTWRMIESSHRATRTDAWAAQFNVPVPVDGTAVLRYRVRVTY